MTAHDLMEVHRRSKTSAYEAVCRCGVSFGRDDYDAATTAHSAHYEQVQRLAGLEQARAALEGRD